MKTLLIPVDFTETSSNAVNFGIEWSKAFGYDHIILLKTLYNSVFDAIIPSEGFAHVSQDYMHQDMEDAQQGLTELSNRITTQLGDTFKVSAILSEQPLLRAILNTAEETDPALIIIGSDNYDYSGNSFVASNVISIAKISPVRVLIVPDHYQYKPLHQVLVPCDFKRLENLDKLTNSYYHDTVNWADKKLLVLNIDAKEKYIQQDEEFITNEARLKELLQNFQYKVYYSNDKNILNGVMKFSNENEVELIVALPGTHSFLYQLTHKSISEAIYRNATKPVLILK
jgi:nucleotide-binding universal stress UspA family protein